MRSSGDVSANQPADGGHFAFGLNWSRFLSALNDDRIEAAKRSVCDLLHVRDLAGRRFLDAGSGSGLFSLAAHQLGAEVVSFDLDQDSVACTREVQRRYASTSSDWQVTQGSLTDREFLQSLGEFDVVYCWGVAHHTGKMWEVLENLLPLVRDDGLIVLAIYNDQLYISRAWRGVKQFFQRLPAWLRPVLVAAVGAAAFLKRLATTVAASVLRLVTLRNPFTPFCNWARESQARGMHGWYDLVDWVGGWPFEVARPEAVFRFLRDRGFTLRELTTSLGHGCNEFVFERNSSSTPRFASSNRRL